MIATLTRQALSVAITTDPARRQQLFALLPKDTFKGPVLYFNLGRFFSTDTTTEDFAAVAKAAKTDPVVLAELMAEDESFRPLHEHLIRLLSEQQAAALKAGQDVTPMAAAITKIAESAIVSTEGGRLLQAVTIEQLLQNVFPERESLLHPILHTQSLNMVHAWRGLGKTHFGLGLSYAVASGGTFLKWKAPRPRGVLYLDGEMPGNALQERIAAIVAANDDEPTPGFFRVVTPDLQEPGNMPDLSTVIGQAAIDELITLDTALIVVDNLSCLCRSGRENEGESWLPVQGWALRHRAAGRSVLFIHHSGKNGEQRGNSKKEDVLDLVLKLKRPVDYEPSQGACFEVIFEKARHLSGEDTASFEATLTRGEDTSQIWVFKDVVETTYERVVSLANEGLSQTEIANELEVNRSTVSRHIRKAKEEGRLSESAKK